MTIDPAQPGVKVVLTDMSVTQGNATGLGGADPMTSAADDRVRSADMGTMVASPSSLTTLPIMLDRLAAHDPVLAALVRQQFGDRPTWQPAPTWAAQALPVTSVAPAASVDCGGGIYVRRTAIELQRVYVSASIASTTQDGYGGALHPAEVNSPTPQAPGVRPQKSCRERALKLRSRRPWPAGRGAAESGSSPTRGNQVCS